MALGYPERLISHYHIDELPVEIALGSLRPKTAP
jgi:hypothetical protein